MCIQNIKRRKSGKRIMQDATSWEIALSFHNRIIIIKLNTSEASKKNRNVIVKLNVPWGGFVSIAKHLLNCFGLWMLKKKSSLGFMAKNSRRLWASQYLQCSRRRRKSREVVRSFETTTQHRGERLVYSYLIYVWKEISPGRCSIVVSIPACHAGDPGSIPGNGDFLIFCFTTN